MIIATFVRKEMEVGIMIVHPHSYMVDMEVGNQLNHSKEEDSEVGNTIVKLNGSKSWFYGVMDSTLHYG